MKRLRRGVGWMWRHKIRTGGIFVAMLSVAWAVVYAVVALAVSPADQSVPLPDGRSLAYMILQDAPPTARRVILVHGAPANASSWNLLLRKGARDLAGLELLAVDRLGYGNSSAGSELSLAEHARSLEPLLGDGVILVGHSYGGPVVLRAAAEFPDRVGGIVLVAGACDPYMNDSQITRRAINAVALAIPEPWVVANRELLALTGENRDMIDLLDRVTCPVVVVHGTWDPVCPHDGTVEYLKRSLVSSSGVRVVSLERVGHNIHLTRPAVLAGEIRALAASLDSTAHEGRR